MIELREVRFSYPASAGAPAVVFEGLSLRVLAGRYAAVMGPNGSGKSTLGKLVKGLLSPSSGEVRIAGRPLRRGEISSRVGYVFSNPENQIVSGVVEEDVAFGLGNRGVAPALMSARVEESLRLVGMESYRHHSPQMLSGGQQQKVVLAGILAMECEVLVLDEPTSMVDPGERRDILELFGRLHRERGLTLLHITHSFEEALRAQDLIYLEGGRISFAGSPEDFLTAPGSSGVPPPEAPPFFQLLRGLRERGHGIPAAVRSPEELVQFLIRRRNPRAEA